MTQELLEAWLEEQVNQRIQSLQNDSARTSS
jgi:hypothetical protein